MGKITIMLIAAELVSKIFGFLRDVTLSYFYGTSSISDAYLICLTIPMVIFTFIGTGLSTSYIPVYNELCQEKSSDTAEKFTSNLINLMMVVCSVIILVCIAFTPPIIKVFASGFSEELLKITVKFTRLSVWGIYFATIIFIGTSYLQMKNKFLLPPLTGIVFNSLIIFSIFLGAKFNSIILALGSVVGVAMQSLIILVAMKKNGFKHSFIFDHKDSSIRRMMDLIIPVILGVSASQINVLIDRTISSRIVVGGVSTLIYAGRLSLFIQTLFVATIAAVMYPKITKLAAENKMDLHSEMFKKSLLYISLLLLPITIGSMVFSESIIRLLYGRGAFTSSSLKTTSSVLFYYSIGMVGTGFREILLKVFYSLEDTKTSTKNATISVCLNIILNIILAKYMGIPGLALATSISATFCAVLLFISLRKKIGPLGLKGLTISFIKILLASLITGILAKLIFNQLSVTMSQNLSFITSTMISIINYFILIYFMRIKGIHEILKEISLLPKQIDRFK